MKIKSDERGYTMMEIIAFIGFLAVLGGGVFSMIKNATNQMKTQQSVAQVQRILKSARAVFASDQTRPSAETAQMTPASLLKLGVYDQTDANDEKAFTPYGTEMVFALCKPGDASPCDGTSPYPYFTLTYKAIPPRICIDLLAGDWGSDPSSGLKQIQANSTVFTWEGKSPAKPLLPSMTDSIAVCAPKENTIIWSYYL